MTKDVTNEVNKTESTIIPKKYKIGYDIIIDIIIFDFVIFMNSFNFLVSSKWVNNPNAPIIKLNNSRIK